MDIPPDDLEVGACLVDPLAGFLTELEDALIGVLKVQGRAAEGCLYLSPPKRPVVAGSVLL